MWLYLECILHIKAAELKIFTQHVKKEYGAERKPNQPKWVSTPAIPTSSSSTTVAPLVSPIESSSTATRPSVISTAPAQSYPSPRSSPPTPDTSNAASLTSSPTSAPPPIPDTPPPGEDQAATAASTHAPTDTTIKAKHLHQSFHHSTLLALPPGRSQISSVLVGSSSWGDCVVTPLTQCTLQQNGDESPSFFSAFNTKDQV
ncbi:hypothetical protein FRC19_004643 [Serendipita sp. 401]|nr:hypothetical protein FRC19_004643 [Serendipita sp. 401]KAG9053149.1 hypothetical protein FS842_008609 [Serendipita sp. 407]